MGPVGSACVSSSWTSTKKKKHELYALKVRKNKPWAGTMTLSEQKEGNKPTRS